VTKQRKSSPGDAALREFYQACGLSTDTIEGAIKTRYRDPTKTAPRETDIAKRLRGDRILRTVRRAK
jgi:hypothetical protein